MNKEQIQRAAYVAVEQIYGKYLQEHTFEGKITSEKAAIANSWRIDPIGFLEFKFTNDNYFMIELQEHGLKPQIIRARNKKYMRFKKPASRKSNYQKIPGNRTFESQGYIYTKAIRHPGVEGRLFIESMLNNQQLQDKLKNTIYTLLNKMIKK